MARPLIPLIIAALGACALCLGQDRGPVKPTATNTQKSESESLPKTQSPTSSVTTQTSPAPLPPAGPGENPPSSRKKKWSFDEVPLFQFLKEISPILTIGLGIFVFWKSWRVRGENQLEYFRAVHKEFWENPQMRKVRCWLACPEWYAIDVRPVLILRNDRRWASPKQYEVLESLDNFLNFMTTVIVLSENFFGNKLFGKKKHDDVLDQTFFGYWIAQTLVDPELAVYVEAFYEKVFAEAKRQRQEKGDRETPNAKAKTARAYVAALTSR
jgi:hypothetical protein